MSWKDERSACDAIRRMLAGPHLQHLWTADGPTPEACDLLDAGGGPLSHGQQVMLRAAFDLWNGQGNATLGDLVNVLDTKNLRAVLGALGAARDDLGTT